MKKPSKQPLQKLSLKKETLRLMSAKELRQVIGASESGGGPTADCTYECG